jgi:AraC-like DNA-binding protein
MSARRSEVHIGEARGVQTRQALFSGLGVSVVDFQCRAHVEPLGPEEPNETHSIVFVRRGVFMRTDRERTIVADANHIVFFNPGEPYRFAHPLPGGDDCTVLGLDEPCARTLAAAAGPARTGTGGAFPIGHAMSTQRAARLHLELLRVLSSAVRPLQLDAQDLVAELADESVASLRQSARARSPATASASRRRDTVEAAKLMVSRSIASPPSLASLASALDCSPFHLSRIFRAETGLGLRHYVRRLRARLAAERLRRGARDLTSVALDLGFYDHSHFTNVFRREWGVPPSKLTGSRSAIGPTARSGDRD